ncbi:MAG TPA: autotransporter-associated beta strand repeat-containing protein [Candidatus Paceibacterota bacterium]|nr:autotransporter-associated beta strand repeat-containing protein [Candidatus Paceibacterota bacterium]
MKITCKLLFPTTLLLAVLPLTSRASTFFSETFTGGSTINSATPVNATLNSASYETVSAKAWNPTPSITTGDLKFGIAATTSGAIEIQAVFSTNALALTQVGDYIQMTVVFTNTAGLVTANNTFLAFGLYNSGGSFPVGGGLNGTATTSSSDHATDGVAGWQGYVGQMVYNGNNGHQILTRAAQTGTANNNQDLVTTGSSSQSYRNPSASTVGSRVASTLVLTAGATYTETLRITLTDINTLAITNSLYDGPSTNGTLLVEFGGIASGSTYLTSGFDGLAIGWRETANAATTMDISSIDVSGEITTITTPPDITLQPQPVSVPNGGSAAFFVQAQGFNVTYQWKRNGTNLINGGNISGATSDTLVISPAGTDDVASGANGYYVTVSGAGGFSVDSVTNALTLIAAKNLTWAGSGSVWDLNTSANWQLSGGTPATFNFGDAVTFNGGTPTGVSLNGKYLSASSVTVDGTTGYSFMGTGSFSGPGKLIFTGTFLDIANANTFTGGTIISNPAALLYLENYQGLGSGPVTFAQAGGTLEVVPAGSASAGINGDLIVADDFTVQFDSHGTYAGVIFGNLSGTAGKTLTLGPVPAEIVSTNRYRIFGTNTVYNANLLLNGNSTTMAIYDGTVLAPYHSSGIQAYNGIISGNGGIVQRAGGTTVLNGANTYSGGTFPTTGTIGFGCDTTGGGSVTAGPIGTGPLYLAPELPNVTGSGAVMASGGPRTVGNPIQYPSATNNQTLIVSGTNNLTFTGPVTLNGNDGQGTQTTRTFQVNNTALTTISGKISGAGFGFTKTGTGVLALNNSANDYSGPTTVSGGTLLVNGQIGSGAVTVTNATLGGSGVVGGAVAVQNLGKVAPGNQAIGTLTLNNSLALLGGSTTAIEVNKQAGTRDRVIANSITYGGTLFVTNLSGTINSGDSFVVFSGAGTGNFTNIVGSPGAGLGWSFDPASGTLSAVATVNPNPTNITVSVVAGGFTLSWPADHLGWTLQSNAVSLTATDAWFAVPGSTTVTNISINVDATKTNVFYRLKF